MNSLQQLSSISKLLASRNDQNSDVYAHYIHSFSNVSDRSDHESSFIFSFEGSIYSHITETVTTAA